MGPVVDLGRGRVAPLELMSRAGGGADVLGLACVDLGEGRVVWRDPDHPSAVPPVRVGGRLAVLDGATLVWRDAETGRELGRLAVPTASPTEDDEADMLRRVIPVGGGACVVTQPRRRSTLLAFLDLDRPGVAASVEVGARGRVHVDVEVDGEGLLVGGADGEGGLSAWGADGQVRWTTRVGDRALPFGAGDGRVVVRFNTPERRRWTAVVDARDGRLLAELPLPLAEPVCAGGLVIGVDERRRPDAWRVHAWTAEGAERWAVDLPAIIGDDVTLHAPGDVLVVVREQRAVGGPRLLEVRALDLASGATLWSRPAEPGDRRALPASGLLLVVREAARGYELLRIPPG